ncbi:hypothetical protein COO60DRAFT_1627135 [Scenedesmus sp. NREL 46B-D3]|nr:hypothetical protein COO60DRAFT_1627135 [Scenedesmus sp. NREL 46B-D3]
MLFYSYFKTLVGKEVTVELKNDLAITGILHSVDQYLNIKLTNTHVQNETKYPHMMSVRNCFIRGSVVRYVLPCLENKNLGRKQTLTYLKGYQHENPDISGLMSSDGAARPSGTRISAGTFCGSPKSAPTSPSATGLPKWVEQNGQVLRFFGFFQEAVTESNIENHRVRRVVVLYYLADDTLQVTEPKQDNSGIPQGVFVKRHQVDKEDGTPFTPTDLAVGQTVTVYGRTYILVDADAFTRRWYDEKLDLQLAAPGDYPGDPVDEYRQRFGLASAPVKKSNDLATFVEARLGKPSHLLEGDRLKQFLAQSGKVLRFYAVWDDRSGLCGDRRPYVVHYYLEDDTVEINEVHERNSGRDPFPVFLKRAPLPREKPRGATLTGRIPKSLCYRPCDFRLGGYVSVHGRNFLLHDCDVYTREYYMAELGYPSEVLEPLHVAEAIPPLPRPALPPYNGYGTLDDSKQNCVALVPKPPKKDMHKLMNKDKIILRFTARMTPGSSVSHADAGRRFVLSYFMMDDSLLIFEPPVRNSGIIGGKFLERQRVYKPQSEEIYTYKDLYVGGQLEVFTRSFELLDADEYTYTYMENNKHIFIMADADAILSSLRVQAASRADAVRTALIETDSQGVGYLTCEQLGQALSRAGLKFTRHQVISLRRKLDRDRTGSVTTDDVLAVLGLTPGQ